MPTAKRARRAPADDWQQLQLLTSFPEQRTYEPIRPVVRFGQSPAERARQTGTPQRTLYRQAARFNWGKTSLCDPTKTEEHRRVPEKIRQHIVAPRAELAARRMHEITTICWIRFGRRPRRPSRRGTRPADPCRRVAGRPGRRPRSGGRTVEYPLGSRDAASLPFDCCDMLLHSQPIIPLGDAPAVVL